MTPADPKTSTTAPAVQEARRGPRRAARAKVDYTLTERHRAAIERLEQLADDIVGRLDLIDRDPDLEETGDDEPVLGAPEPQGGHVQRGYGRMDQRHWNDGAGDDREQDDEREPVCEDEGAQCEDEGAVFDDEPSLGWAAAGNQGPKMGVGTLIEQEVARQLVWDAAELRGAARLALQRSPLLEASHPQKPALRVEAFNYVTKVQWLRKPRGE